MLDPTTLAAELAAAEAARDQALATANYQAGRVDALRAVLVALAATPPATPSEVPA